MNSDMPDGLKKRGYVSEVQDKAEQFAKRLGSGEGLEVLNRGKQGDPLPRQGAVSEKLNRAIGQRAPQREDTKARGEKERTLGRTGTKGRGR